MTKAQMEKYLTKAIDYIFHHKAAKKKTRVKKATVKQTFAQEVGIPEPDHVHGYTDENLRSFLTKKEHKQFWKWMYGQTCAFDKELNQCIAYGHDVMRFVELVRKGKPTYWD